MIYVLGVDGGGTRTRAVLVDEVGTVLGRGEFTGSVVTVQEPASAARAVSEAAATAAREAGIALPVDVLWAGLAGAGSRDAREAVEAALEERGVARSVVVGTDVEAAFHHAFPAGEGVLLIAGTGSIAWARRPDGSVRQVGGWGQQLGDEGSGYSIGLAGLRRLVRSHDGRAPETSLREPLLSACGIASVPELVGWIGGATKGEVASLAPLVVAEAEAGDGDAQRIVEDAVAALVEHVRVALEEAPGSPVVLWGGLVADGGPLRTRLMAALEEDGVVVEERMLDPPLGAARLALAFRR